jgi:hypothetical protein
MGISAETAIVDYCLLFADQDKQTSVFRFRLSAKKQARKTRNAGARERET